LADGHGRVAISSAVSVLAPPSTSQAARIASLGLIALVLFCLLWELLLAPLRPDGSWLALKALPLALLVPSALRGTRRALQWLSLLLPFYVAEGVVRGFTESGRHALVAWVAAAIAAATFVALLAWVRSSRPRPP
jgi:uncharacterized membrane protein